MRFFFVLRYDSEPKSDAERGVEKEIFHPSLYLVFVNFLRPNAIRYLHSFQVIIIC